MDKILKIVLIVAGVVVIAGGLLFAGSMLGSRLNPDMNASGLQLRQQAAGDNDGRGNAPGDVPNGNGGQDGGRSRDERGGAPNGGERSGRPGQQPDSNDRE